MLLAKSFCKYRVHQLPSVLSSYKSWNQEKLFSGSSIKGKDLYRILGVSPSATQTEIKDAYYKLTLKFHPDRNEGSPEAAVRFHDITEAYEVLGNYFLRKRYDKGMPLPTRHEEPTAEPGIPHVVQYQKFFDARNLPYQPSAYAAGGGARKFDEYHAKQFSERQTRSIIDEDREYKEMCESRKTPTMIGLVLFLYVVKQLRDYVDMTSGPRVEVEHFERYPFKWDNYAEPIPPQL